MGNYNYFFKKMEASNEVAELLGAKLVKGDGTETDFNQWYGEFKGEGKYIGLYYGAHWAPPSRLFTRNLKEKFYDPIKGDANLAKLIEVVFVSDDREQDAFKRNVAQMPWFAIPFDQGLLMQTLKSKFGVSELPTFAIINAQTGRLVKLEGRQDVFKGAKAFEDWD